MQKMKLNTNAVGASIARQNFEGKAKNNQKGITLIALIITIIVMLILVGVTINVALNGGLFQKAEYASEQMQIKAEEEELLSAVVAAIGTDAKVDFNYLDDHLPTEKWTKVAEKTYKSPKNNVYEVDDYGKITYKGKNIGGGSEPAAFTWESVGLTVDTAAVYENTDMHAILKFSEDGKVKIMSTDGVIMAEIDATNSDNIVDGIINCSMTIDETPTNVKLKMNEEDENDETIYAEVEESRTIPFVKVAYGNVDVYSNEEVLKMLEIANYTGTYTETWTVLERGEDGKPIKLVSTGDVATYTLGNTDPRATNQTVGSTSEYDKAIWSYKNAENTLNAIVEEAIKGIPNARSINIEDIEALVTVEKGTDYKKPYTYNYTNHSGQMFVNESGTTVKIDSAEKEIPLENTDYNYVPDEDEIKKIPAGNYWLGSPCVKTFTSHANFHVRWVLVTEYGAIIGSDMLFSSKDSTSSGTHGVRAVVSI